eukprot:2846530-Prymnesium_polylepis.1
MLGQLAALARPGVRSRSPVAPERRPGVPGHDFVLGRASDRPGMPPVGGPKGIFRRLSAQI